MQLAGRPAAAICAGARRALADRRPLGRAAMPGAQHRTVTALRTRRPRSSRYRTVARAASMLAAARLTAPPDPPGRCCAALAPAPSTSPCCSSSGSARPQRPLSGQRKLRAVRSAASMRSLVELARDKAQGLFEPSTEAADRLAVETGVLPLVKPVTTDALVGVTIAVGVFAVRARPHVPHATSAADPAALLIVRPPRQQHTGVGARVAVGPLRARARRQPGVLTCCRLQAGIVCAPAPCAPSGRGEVSFCT